MAWKATSWNPEYVSGDVMLDPNDSGLSVQADYEGNWEPIGAVANIEWPTLYFIDGKLRVDQAVMNPEGIPGILATVVVGAIRRTNHEIAPWGNPYIRRLFLYPHHSSAQIFDFGADLRYDPLAVDANSFDELKTQASFKMRELEATVSQQINEFDALIILDGPFVASRLVPGIAALAYAKTMSKRYLDLEKHKLLAEMPSGTRTPIFRIEGTKNRPELWSWYVKLPISPEQLFHAQAGILRVEAPFDGDVLEAQRRANLSVDLFCKMASSPVRDSRAPQNLLATGGLEQWLGRYMGDANVLRRRIATGLV